MVHFFAVVVCMQLAHLAELIVIITLSKDTYFVAPHWISVSISRGDAAELYD